MKHILRPTLKAPAMSVVGTDPTSLKQSLPRTLMLAALGLAMVTLALLNGRPGPISAEELVWVTLCDNPNCGAGVYMLVGISAGSSRAVSLEDRWWDDSFSAIQLGGAPGKVAVYSDPQLTGTCEVFTTSDPDFRNNRIGDNTISSFHIGADCGAPVVRLFEHLNFTGGSKAPVTFGGPGEPYEYVPQREDLRRIGFNDTVTSIQVPVGHKVSVWADLDFTGRCETFTASDPDLRNNWIGSDSITSVMLDVDCPMVLFQDLNGGGQAMKVQGDVPNLRDAGFNDSVTSIQVPKGMMMAVYQHANYTGTCETFTASDPDLRDNRIGNDTISSVRVGRGC